MKTFAAIICALSFVAFFYVGSPMLAAMRYGEIPANFRNTVLDRNLSGLHSGIAILLPSGAMAVVRESDVASIGDSRCTRESGCISGRRSCTRTFVLFECGYKAKLKDGRDAATYLKISTTMGLLPDFSPVTAEDFRGEGSDFDDASAFLCRNDFGCRTRYQPPTPLPPDPRGFQDCQGGFCAPEMLTLPQGTFKRGTAVDEMQRMAADAGHPNDLGAEEAEGPVADVSINYLLAIGRFEMTTADWLLCVDDKACPEETRPGPAQLKQQPIIYVTWNDVTQHYLPWLNGKLQLSGAYAYRLPTEAEWEYAARAGTTTRYASGHILDSHAALFSASDTLPGVVGSFPPNAFGLYDTAGNAGELVQDCYAHGFSKSPVDGAAYDPPGCGESRVAKGGSWRQLPVYLRPAYRSLAIANRRWAETGFRLARSLPR